MMDWFGSSNPSWISRGSLNWQVFAWRKTHDPQRSPNSATEASQIEVERIQVFQMMFFLRRECVQEGKIPNLLFVARFSKKIWCSQLPPSPPLKHPHVVVKPIKIIIQPSASIRDHLHRACSTMWEDLNWHIAEEENCQSTDQCRLRCRQPEGNVQRG